MRHQKKLHLCGKVSDQLLLERHLRLNQAPFGRLKHKTTQVIQTADHLTECSEDPNLLYKLQQRDTLKQLAREETKPEQQDNDRHVVVQCFGLRSCSTFRLLFGGIQPSRTEEDCS
ncbi:hypothetical protein T10_171 [Trichinella papuae]|uniref:Uncharacterized protein n=1 Tax=Trichinella papuae TaxID=268474 RepID=A0A0V1MJM4_9BILA|nr:hypothetical protein T10_171 [Trichinella papuae]